MTTSLRGGLAAVGIPMLLGAVVLAGPAAGADTDPASEPAGRAPANPALVFARGEADTLRSNLQVAEALLGEAAAALLAALPPPPATVVLVPGSTEPAANLLTNVATAQLQAAGYAVHLDRVPAGTDGPAIEFRYRVEELRLDYPDTGRRLGLWKAWIGREVNLVLQATLVAADDGRIIASRRLVRGYRDRIPAEHLAAVESRAYPFTTATPQESGIARQFEEIVVLGALVGLVAIYFANTE